MTIKPIRNFNLEKEVERAPCCNHPIKGSYIVSLMMQGKLYDCYKCNSCGRNGVFVPVTKLRSLTDVGEYWDG